MEFRRTRSVPISTEVIWERDSEESTQCSSSIMSGASAEREGDKHEEHGSQSSSPPHRLKRSSTIGSALSELTELTKHRQREEDAQVATLSEMQAWKLLGQRRKEALQKGGASPNPSR